MKKDMTLLIMAAGMGSRFGGLKQIEPVGPSSEFIIDYSVYDAIQAGFNKIVFVIKENVSVFKKTIGSRIEPFVQVEYCFQELDDLPKNYPVPEGRVKPWGTAHAILAAKEKIKENFAIINADDFYGREAFLDIAHFLQEDVKENTYAIIGYDVEKTLTENGSVKRAVLKRKNDQLEALMESSIEKKNGRIMAFPLDGSQPFAIASTQPVSLNLFGFSPSLFTYIEENFLPFLEENKDNLLTCEYLIPTLIGHLIQTEEIEVKLIPTRAEWIGVTYKEDKEYVMQKINEEIKRGNYKKKFMEVADHKFFYISYF